MILKIINRKLSSYTFQGNRVQATIKGKHISKFQLLPDEGACYRIGPAEDGNVSDCKSIQAGEMVEFASGVKGIALNLENENAVHSLNAVFMLNKFAKLHDENERDNRPYHFLLYAKIPKIHRENGWTYLACKKCRRSAKEADFDESLSRGKRAKNQQFWNCRIHKGLTASLVHMRIASLMDILRERATSASKIDQQELLMKAKRKGNVDNQSSTRCWGASCATFTEHGAKIVIADIQDQLVQGVWETISSPKSIYVHCDVTNKEDVKNAIDIAYVTYGKLGIMFNNDVVMDPYQARVIGNEKTDFERVHSVNVTCRFFKKFFVKGRRVFSPLPHQRHVADTWCHVAGTWLPPGMWVPFLTCGGGCPMTAYHVAASDMSALQVSVRVRGISRLPEGQLLGGNDWLVKDLRL
nr:secoisolariciresinol dehydrogenase-like [Tanacetum cinerariifolium]